MSQGVKFLEQLKAVRAKLVALHGVVSKMAASPAADLWHAITAARNVVELSAWPAETAIRRAAKEAAEAKDYLRLACILNLPGEAAEGEEEAGEPLVDEGITLGVALPSGPQRIALQDKLAQAHLQTALRSSDPDAMNNAEQLTKDGG
jgi:hypothetical protein